MHTKSPLNFETAKLEALVDMDLRNVFCSLGYFNTWLLRCLFADKHHSKQMTNFT